jgi:hypothetical protein
MRALWNGERDFDGKYWSFHDATSEPHPSPQPEIWVGGGSERAIRRALEPESGGVKGGPECRHTGSPFFL